MEANYDDNPFKMMASLAASFAQQLEEMGKKYAEAMQQIRAFADAAQNGQKVASNSATTSGKFAGFDRNEMGEDAPRIGQTAYSAHEAIMNERTAPTICNIENNAEKLFAAHKISRNERSAFEAHQTNGHTWRPADHQVFGREKNTTAAYHRDDAKWTVSATHHATQSDMLPLVRDGTTSDERASAACYTVNNDVRMLISNSAIWDEQVHAAHAATREDIRAHFPEEIHITTTTAPARPSAVMSQIATRRNREKYGRFDLEPSTKRQRTSHSPENSPWGAPERPYVIDSESGGDTSEEYVALSGDEADMSDSSGISDARLVSKRPSTRIQHEADLSNSISLSKPNTVANISNTRTHHEVNYSDSSNISAVSIISKIPNVRSRPVVELSTMPRKLIPPVSPERPSMVAPHIPVFRPFVQRTIEIIPEALYEAEEAFQVKQAMTRETRARFRGPDPNNRTVAEPDSDASTTLDHSDDESGSETCEEKGSKDAVNTYKKGSKRGRDFPGPTNEELARARFKCQRFIDEVAAEETPKKEALWKQVHEWAEKNNIQPAPRKDPYLKHEWPEPPHIGEYLRRRLAAIPVQIAQTKTLAQISQKNDQLVEPSPAVPKHLINGCIVLKDSDSETLLVKVSTGIDEVFEIGRENEPPMHIYIQQTWDRLYNRGIKAPPPKGGDQCYPRSYYNAAKRYWESKGKDCGVHNLACLQNPAGRANSSDVVGPWSHTLSKDVLGSRAGDVGIRLRFLSDLAPVQQAMSLWFAAIDKEQYSEYRSHVDFLAQENMGMSTIKVSNDQSFMGITAVRNLQAHNHKDQDNVPSGWVGMTCQGSFTGGHLVLPDQQLTLRFLPGDVIFLRSSLVSHMITPCVGERSSLVFFSPSTPAINVHSTHEPSRTTLEALIDQPVLRQWEKGKLEAQKKELSKGSKPYPTKESDLTEKKLRAAEVRKRKFVRYAEGQVEKGEMDEGDLEKLRDTPIPAFYELTLIELERWSKGEYPFTKTGSGNAKKRKTAE